MIISRTFGFDAAHSIPSHEGKCKNLHGHFWKVEVALKGKYEAKDVMLMDFGVLKEIVHGQILARLDHTNLNEFFIFEPSAENIALWIYGELDYFISELQSPVSLHFIKVWESEDCYAQVGGA